GVPRARDGRHARAGGDARRALHADAGRSVVARHLRAGRIARRDARRPIQHAAVPDHPPLPRADVRGADPAADRQPGVALMGAVALAVALQLVQLALVLVLAPALTGLVRKLKARLLGRRGPPLLQPYRDLAKLLRKEAVIAENASWLFRAAPYMMFALMWLAAALVPTFTTRLP